MAIDRLLNKLPQVLNEPVHHELLPWLREYIPLSDSINVDAHRFEMASMLRAAGYSADSLTGLAPSYYSSPTRLRIYIVGQVLSMVETLMCIHPGIVNLIPEDDS
jgi:hypothetical protein